MLFVDNFVSLLFRIKVRSAIFSKIKQNINKEKRLNPFAFEKPCPFNNFERSIVMYIYITT